MSSGTTLWNSSSENVDAPVGAPSQRSMVHASPGNDTAPAGDRAASSTYCLPRTLQTGARPAFVLVMLGFIIGAPALLSDYVLSAVLVPVLTLALAGTGQNILTGYAGQLSVGSAAFMCVGAFATYGIHSHWSEVPLLASFAFGGFVAALFGVLVGLPSLRIRGFYLVVSTLAAQFFVVWLFTTFGWFSNYSTSGVVTAPTLSIGPITLSSPGGHYWLALLVVAPLTWIAHNLARGRLGRSWMAVRDMEAAAAVVGVRTGTTKLGAFAVSSFYCGVAGSLWAFVYLGTIEPHGLDLDRSFQVLFIAILGGLGSIAGPFVGAAFVVLLPVALDRVSAALLGSSIDPGVVQNVDKIVFGTLVIVLLVRQPAGMVRLIHIFGLQCGELLARLASAKRRSRRRGTSSI